MLSFLLGLLLVLTPTDIRQTLKERLLKTLIMKVKLHSFVCLQNNIQSCELFAKSYQQSFLIVKWNRVEISFDALPKWNLLKITLESNWKVLL